MFIFQDWSINKGNTKGRIVALCFRVANFAHNKGIILKILFIPYLIFYKIVFEWILGIELPYNTSIGSGLQIYHLQAIVINRMSVIGENFILRHSTTIGNRGVDGKCPIIGNNVEVGAHVCILGGIVIGDDVKIGAGSIVLKDLPSGSIAVGNPAKIINIP